ncbi:MAG: DUF3467 domain-containing protein [Flavobacteriaceae bacterium]|nr:DUF3467 domain-containing protein [Flavobacteriaceae bacterium]
MSEDKKDNLNIELSEKVGEGLYTNLAIINHSSSEFIVDFVNVMPAVPKARVKARIIMTAENTKKFLNALKQNIEIYERTHGKINVSENKGNMPMNFGPSGEA